MAETSEFEKSIGLKFKNKDLLKQAFIHRSYLNENSSLKNHNERLEFLGDAVLELVITDYLYNKYPEKSEGEMTAFRAALVNANMLSVVAAELSVGDYMSLSKGEAKSLPAGRQLPTKAGQYILANAMEAIIGAVYLDKGYKETFKFLERILLPKIKEIIDNKLWVDAKSFFQEKAQEMENVTPAYKVIGETGPDHDKIFEVGVFLSDKMIASGSGASKQEAEQNAARNGLKEKNWGI